MDSSPEISAAPDTHNFEVTHFESGLSITKAKSLARKKSKDLGISRQKCLDEIAIRQVRDATSYGDAIDILRKKMQVKYRDSLPMEYSELICNSPHEWRHGYYWGASATIHAIVCGLDEQNKLVRLEQYDSSVSCGNGSIIHHYSWCKQEELRLANKPSGIRYFAPVDLLDAPPNPGDHITATVRLEPDARSYTITLLEPYKTRSELAKQRVSEMSFPDELQLPPFNRNFYGEGSAAESWKEKLFFAAYSQEKQDVPLKKVVGFNRPGDGYENAVKWSDVIHALKRPKWEFLRFPENIEFDNPTFDSPFLHKYEDRYWVVSGSHRCTYAKLGNIQLASNCDVVEFEYAHNIEKLYRKFDELGIFDITISKKANYEELTNEDSFTLRFDFKDKEIECYWFISGIKLLETFFYDVTEPVETTLTKALFSKLFPTEYPLAKNRELTIAAARGLLSKL
jgi:hypothetical protein